MPPLGHQRKQIAKGKKIILKAREEKPIKQCTFNYGSPDFATVEAITAASKNESFYPCCKKMTINPFLTSPLLITVIIIPTVMFHKFVADIGKKSLHIYLYSLAGLQLTPEQLHKRAHLLTTRICG